MQNSKPSVHQIPQYSVCSPKSVKLCQNAEKVRALEYNKNTWVINIIMLTPCKVDVTVSLLGVSVCFRVSPVTKETP